MLRMQTESCTIVPIRVVLILVVGGVGGGCDGTGLRRLLFGSCSACSLVDILRMFDLILLILHIVLLRHRIFLFPTLCPVFGFLLTLLVLVLLIVLITRWLLL